MTYREATAAAQAADDAWSDALALSYGRKARDARYDDRGRATPDLEALYTAKITADAAMRDAFYASRLAA